MFNKKKFLCIIAVMIFLLSVNGCKKSQLEFTTMQKIDAHLHIRYSGAEFLDQAATDNFKVIAILTDHYDIGWQKEFIDRQRLQHAQQIAYITTFTIQGWDDPDWQEKTIAHLKNEFANGAIGVKVWKNIGMEFKDKDTNFVMIDHPRFDAIFDFIESQGKTLTGHIGEPRDCWLPMEKMIAESNRRYYTANPEYHMYHHSEYPSYEDQINSYKRMLKKHPHLRYVGCHLGSIEWSMAELAKVMDEFPNMTVDLAARIDDIQLLDRDKVRQFFINYQDRILYGTDLNIKEQHDPKAYAEYAHQTWLNDWTYFATDSVLTIPGIDKPVAGLDLPDVVLEKIYRRNVARCYLYK